MLTQVAPIIQSASEQYAWILTSSDAPPGVHGKEWLIRAKEQFTSNSRDIASAYRPMAEVRQICETSQQASRSMRRSIVPFMGIIKV